VLTNCAESFPSSLGRDMAPLRVALAGATGNLGISVLEALLQAHHSVTVLSRIGGNSSKLKPYTTITIKQIDFSNSETIRPALEGIDVVVSCLATLAIGSQDALIDASCAAGVRRFIPAEFGMDSLNPLCAGLPVCQPKVATRQYLQEKHANYPHFTWTGIANGLFLDWGLNVGFIIDPAHHTATLYNGGDVLFSATTLADVAKAVVGVIEKQDETKNRLVYIQSAAVTQNHLISYAREEGGQDWTLATRDLEDVLKDSHVELERGEMQAAMDGYCKVAMWDTKYGGNFSSHLDNDLLGIEMLTEAELRAVFESSMR